MNGKIGIFLYAKFSGGYDEETDEEIILDENNEYTLLDVVSSYWENENNGLARYLDDELKKYIKRITYCCTRKGPYIEFHVEFDNAYNENIRVKYEGKEQPLYKIVCDFISGQISDGWGENGIYVIDGGWIGSKAICVTVDSDLYKKDIETSHKLEEEATGEKVFFGDFDKYPAYKKIKDDV